MALSQGFFEHCDSTIKSGNTGVMYKTGTEFIKKELGLSAFLPCRELAGYRLVHDTMIIPRLFLAGTSRNGIRPSIMQTCGSRYIHRAATAGKSSRIRLRTPPQRGSPLQLPCHPSRSHSNSMNDGFPSGSTPERC